MKMKGITAMTLAVTMGLGMQFVNPSALVNSNVQAIGMQSAEAGMLDGVGASLAKARNSVTSSVKHSVDKALNVDMDGLTKHQKSMKRNLVLATLFTAGAQYNLVDAGDMLAVGNTAELASFASRDKNVYNADMGIPYKFAEMNGVPSGIGQKIGMRLSTADAATKQNILDRLKWSRENRAMASLFKGLALRDAAFVVKEGGKGVASAKKNGDVNGILNQVNQLVSVAKDTQAICKNLGAKTGAMDRELKSVESQYKIPKVDKSRMDAIKSNIVME
ncbi:MAG: hypothetical protein PUB57_06845 [Selenomonadaceae bacterium]|nr:hypothetical protein [Selenomonadaceae bacterium]